MNDKLPQIDKLLFPQIEPDNGKDVWFPRSDWAKTILNFTKRTEAGKWNEKYGVMVFKANYGYHSAMKKIVDDYVREMKKDNPNIVVMDETDDNRVRTWTIGDPNNIRKMVEDELKP